MGSVNGWMVYLFVAALEFQSAVAQPVDDGPVPDAGITAAPRRDASIEEEPSPRSSSAEPIRTLAAPIAPGFRRGGSALPMAIGSPGCDHQELDVVAADGRRWTTRLYRHRIVYIRTTESGANLEVGEDTNGDGYTGPGDDVWQDDAGTALPLPGTRWVFNWKYPGYDSLNVPASWPATPQYEVRAVRGTYTSAGSLFTPSRHVSDSGIGPDGADYNGYCLDIEWGSSANGAVPQVYTCQGSSHQRLSGDIENGDGTCWDAIGLAFRKEDSSWQFWSPNTYGMLDGRNFRFVHSLKCLNVPWGCVPPQSGPGCEEIQLQQYSCGVPNANANEAFYFHYPNCKLDGDVAGTADQCCSYQRPDGVHCGTLPGAWILRANGQFCTTSLQCAQYNCNGGVCGGVPG